MGATFSCAQSLLLIVINDHSWQCWSLYSEWEMEQSQLCASSLPIILSLWPSFISPDSYIQEKPYSIHSLFLLSSILPHSKAGLAGKNLEYTLVSWFLDAISLVL